MASAVAAGLLIGYRRTIQKRFSKRSGYGALLAGTAFMAVTVTLLFSTHIEPGQTITNPVELNAISVERGATLFTKNCAQCHGETGAGNGPMAGQLPAPPANFRVHVPFHPDGTLFYWITNGIAGTGMPSFDPKLSEKDRWDLVNFLRESFDRPIDSK